MIDIKAEVERLKPILGLIDWEIIYSKQRSGKGTYASIRPAEQQKRATLFIGRDFATLTDDEKRRVIIHELLHCHLMDICHYLADALEDQDVVAQRAIYMAVHDRIEWAVDNIATAIQPYLKP